MCGRALAIPRGPHRRSSDSRRGWRALAAPPRRGDPRPPRPRHPGAGAGLPRRRAARPPGSVAPHGHGSRGGSPGARAALRGANRRLRRLRRRRRERHRAPGEVHPHARGNDRVVHPEPADRGLWPERWRGGRSRRPRGEGAGHARLRRHPGGRGRPRRAARSGRGGRGPPPGFPGASPGRGDLEPAATGLCLPSPPPVRSGRHLLLARRAAPAARRRLLRHPAGAAPGRDDLDLWRSPPSPTSCPHRSQPALGARGAQRAVARGEAGDPGSAPGGRLAGLGRPLVARSPFGSAPG